MARETLTGDKPPRSLVNDDDPPASLRLWAALHLLDHQILDREGRPAGSVDDLEPSCTDNGSLVVTAILSGPGVLAPRLGAARFGRWRQGLHQLWAAADSTQEDSKSCTDNGSLVVTAILSGPGVLAPRLGAARVGRWRQGLHQLWAAADSTQEDSKDPVPLSDDPARIPFGRVQQIGSHITLAVEHDQRYPATPPNAGPATTSTAGSPGLA